MALQPGSGAPIPTVPGAPSTGGLPTFQPMQTGPLQPPLPDEVRRMAKLWGFESGGGLPYATDAMRRYTERRDRFRSSTQAAFQGMPGQPYVYFGKSKYGAGSFKTVTEVMSQFEAMENDRKRELAKKLAMAGYLDVAYAENIGETVEKATLMDLTDAYGALISDAANRFASGEDITPEQLLEMNIRYNLGGVAKGEFSDENIGKWFDSLNKPAKPYTEVTKQVQRDIWSADNARLLARATLKETLGRDPSEAEYEDFVAALQTAQRNNPTVTETRTRYNAEGEAVRSSSTTTGGVNEQGQAVNFVESRPDWAEWQAVGTYFPALMNALGSGVPGA